MNCYTMALPQQRPQPNQLFAVSCGPRSVFAAASVHECVDDGQTPTYTSPKRVKLESEHSHSYPSSPPEATSPPGFHRDFDSCGECSSPASRNTQGHGETWKNLPKKPQSYTKNNNNNNNNNFNANNKNDTTNNHLPQTRISEGLPERISLKANEDLRYQDKPSPLGFLTKRESDCSSSDNTECTNITEERDEQQTDFKAVFRTSSAFHDSSTIHNHHSLIPDSSATGETVLSSPSALLSHSTISMLPAKSSPPSPPSSFSSTYVSSKTLPSLLSVSTPSSFSSSLSASQDLKQEEKQEDYELSECGDKICTNVEDAEDGRTSRLSCIVDIETDTPPTSPVASLSPSQSPLNLSKSCLESSGSDVDHRRETPSRNSDPGRHNAEIAHEHSVNAQNQNGFTSECQNEGEDTGKLQKTNFSIDAILSSTFGAANPATDLLSPKSKDGKADNGCHSPRDSLNDQTHPSSVIHSENSAFSAVDLRVKTSHSNASLSPSSNLSSTSPSPKSFSSPHPRSPNDPYGNSSVTEDENFTKSTNINHVMHYPYPYGHLLKTSQALQPPRDSTRSYDEVFSESKNNIDTNSIHPFQRFFPTMFPSPFPIPKHGGAPPLGAAEMEEFFHRSIPFLNQAYSHLVGKFPLSYMPTEQNFPLHSISKMHPDQNPLFDPNRVLNMPHNNVILHNRSPGLPGNNHRPHPNFPNANDLTENINPKSNHHLPLINNAINKNDSTVNKNCYNRNNNLNESLKSSRLHYPTPPQQARNESLSNNAMLLPQSPKIQTMDSKLPMLKSKSADATLQKSFSKTPPAFLDVKADKSVEVKSNCDVVRTSKRDRKNSSDCQKGTDKATSEAKKDADTLWPAWVFCTRYSDRPSSGPRSRKPKRKASVDEKRPRTAFTNDQLQRLKREFEDCRYLTETRRRNLATELGLSESQIKIWFQNKRAKIKKSLGVKNTLALKLMQEGLYNHSTVKMHEDSN